MRIAGTAVTALHVVPETGTPIGARTARTAPGRPRMTVPGQGRPDGCHQRIRPGPEPLLPRASRPRR